MPSAKADGNRELKQAAIKGVVQSTLAVGFNQRQGKGYYYLALATFLVWVVWLKPEGQRSFCYRQLKQTVMDKAVADSYCRRLQPPDHGIVSVIWL